MSGRKTVPSLLDVAGVLLVQGPLDAHELAKLFDAPVELVGAHLASLELLGRAAPTSSSLWRAAPEQACHVCGCTSGRACFGGCFWVTPTLCSECVVPPPGTKPTARKARARRRKSLEQAVCPKCHRVVSTYVPKGGDGSLALLRRHRCADFIMVSGVEVHPGARARR
jgi:hypothetical protein